MKWHGLLVSVRSDWEAIEAIAGGATIIDVKEPLHGSLGCASPDVIARVAGVVGQDRPWTMACGELRDGVVTILEHLRRTLAVLPASAVPPAAVKIGLAGMARVDWRLDVQTLFSGLPLGPERVIVAYADWASAGAPTPEEVIQAAVSNGCATLLIDTADKSAEGLLAAAHAGRVGGWVSLARREGLQVVLAGRIAIDEINAAVALRPDVVALRSAVCSNGDFGSGRLGTVCGQLVRRAATLCKSLGGLAANG